VEAGRSGGSEGVCLLLLEVTACPGSSNSASWRKAAVWQMGMQFLVEFLSCSG